MKILILGGGSVGGKLAMKLDEPFVIIESDPSRVWELKEMLKDKEVAHAVIHGDGNSIDTIEKAGSDFDAAVVLMNRDFENLEAVSIIKSRGIPRIIARVNAPHNMYKFLGLGAEVFRHPIGYEEGIIKTMLFPDAKHALQIFVREGSPAIDSSIEELELPEGVVIGSILREDSLIPPAPSTVIRSGDLIAVDAVGKKAKEVWKIFSKSGKAESTGHLFCPLNKERDLMAMKEVELLAKRLGSEIYFIVPEGREGLAVSAQGFISKRVPFRTINMGSDENCLLDEPAKMQVQTKGLGRMRANLQNLMYAHMEEGSPHLDIFVIPGPKRTILYFPFIPSHMDRIIAGAPMPVLVSRSPKKYRSVLLYLHPNCTLEVSIAIQICRSMGSDLFALYKPRNRQRALYLKRFSQVYDVNVEAKKIAGNPTVELIREVKEGPHDLVILKKDLKDIQRSQMRRLTHLWTGSVLIVP